MSFKKAKTTFAMAAGRGGIPMSRKPILSAAAKRRSKTSAYMMSKKGRGKTRSVKMGKPRTKRAKGLMNSYRVAKATGMTLQGARDLMNSSFYMGRPTKLRSATRSPQTAPQSFKPRG